MFRSFPGSSGCLVGDPGWGFVTGCGKCLERTSQVSLTFTSKHFCCCSIPRLCPTLCNSTDCRTLGSPVLHHLLELAQPMSIESVMPSNHLILCCLLLLLLSIFPSIRVFWNESALCVRWPKYWSFPFNISPSNEHPGLIFRMD